jgi:hypothetical protein
MSTEEITNPTIYVNGNLWPWMPNTAEIIMGYGEQELKARSLGNGNTDAVYCDNVEAKIGKISWAELTTDDTIGFLEEFKFNGNTNTVRIDTNTGNSYVLQKAILANDPAIPFKAGETYTLEWQSNPVVQSY